MVLRRRSEVALSFGIGLALTGIGFLILLRADPDEARSTLAARILAPIPVMSGHEWVDQFSPYAWLLNVLLWTVVAYAVLGRPPSARRIFSQARSILAAKWRFLALPVVVAASFALYLIPLAPPAGGQWRWFLRDLIRFRSIYPTSLFLAEAGFAVGMQLIVIGAMAWILFGRSLLRFLPSALLILLVFLVPGLVSRGIPIYFLTSRDTAPPRELPFVCKCAGRFEDIARNPVDVHMDEPWLVYGALFQASDCRTKHLDFSVPLSGIDFVIPGGRIVHFKYAEGRHPEWWYYGGEGSAKTRLAGPQDARDHILSSDGGSIAWLEREPETRGPPTQVVVASLAGERLSTIRLPPLSGRISLLAVNRSEDRIVLRALIYQEPADSTRPSDGVLLRGRLRQPETLGTLESRRQIGR